MTSPLPPQNNTSSPSATAVIHKLLTTLKITRVVYIDDYFERGIDFVIEHVAVGVLKDQKEQIEQLFPGIYFEEELEWKRELRDWWDEASATQQQELVATIFALKIIPDREDKKAADAVKKLIPNGVAYEPVSPAEWDKEHAGWFAEANVDNKLLCLFDQQFSYTPVGSQIALDGLNMLENAIKAIGATDEQYSGCALFGILSHQFPIEQERARGIEICVQHGLPVNIFLPLSKKRASTSPSRLAEGIQMLILNLYATSLKKLIKRVMSAACRKASDELDKIDVFAFDDMVLRSSIGEGVWEGETLVRLFSLLQQQAGREDIASDSTASYFNQQVELARAIASPRLTQQDTSAEMLALRRLELYQSDETLNAFHTPLRLGDIFQSASNKRYILLAPPCDLMVRSGDAEIMGKRAKEATAELQYVELFKIQETSPKDVAKLNVNQLRVLGFLQHYNRNKLGRISFKDRVIVPIQVLDLAVINKDGSCQLDTRNSLQIPVQFHPAWRSRYDILISYFKNLAAPMNSLAALLANPVLSPDEQQALGDLMSARLNPGSSLPDKPTYENGRFDFKLQRVDHYRYTASQHLLSSYTGFLSRAAEEHDFSSATHA